MQAVPDDSAPAWLVRLRNIAPSAHPLEAARAHASWWPLVKPELLTWANAVTLVRLIGSLVAFGIALANRDERWNYIGLAIYWTGDILDGQVARRLKQETVFGAEFDILADRILVCLFYLIYTAIHPEKTIVAILFLLEFMVIDHWLSNQFSRWGLKSPNDYHRVDYLTWVWLWSTTGKAFNTGLVTLMTIFLVSPWPPVIVVAVLVAIRVYFVGRALAMSAEDRAKARAA